MDARADRLTALDDAGGVDLLLRVADRFYESVVSDPALLPFFKGVNLERLAIHQAQFLAVIADNDHALLWEDMRLVHADLNVTDAVYDRSLTYLAQALDAEQVPPAVSRRLLMVAELFRRSIVAGGGGPDG